ncbi:MAG: nucleotide pyrophosphohydrolase [Chloroflexi bacterium]|nr:nucleotide pyrophosphohydrolase [Chloroflexota bacterium]
MEIRALSERALDVRNQYAELERANYGRAWTREEIALGFVGDVGDLAKLVMAQNGIRHIEHADEKLAHELADCLWSILVLAQMHGVDLERAFLTTMDDLEKHIHSQRTL